MHSKYQFCIASSSRNLHWTTPIFNQNMPQYPFYLSGNWISSKIESYYGGKTRQPEMGSPKINFKISKTARPILLKFAEHIGSGMVFWKIEHRDCCLKSHGDRQQTKFTFSIFGKFVSPTILKITFQRRVLNKAGICGHLIAHHIWHYCIW